jgi:hypothetical protein
MIPLFVLEDVVENKCLVGQLRQPKPTTATTGGRLVYIKPIFLNDQQTAGVNHVLPKTSCVLGGSLKNG